MKNLRDLKLFRISYFVITPICSKLLGRELPSDNSVFTLTDTTSSPPSLSLFFLCLLQCILDQVEVSAFQRRGRGSKTHKAQPQSCQIRKDLFLNLNPCLDRESKILRIDSINCQDVWKRFDRLYGRNPIDFP